MDLVTWIDQPSFSDTVSLNPQPTWVDPRENPSLYSAHDPSLGVTVHRHGADAGGAATSTTTHAPPAPPPAVTKYPDYPPKSALSTPFLALAGAAVAGGMLYGAAGKPDNAA